MYQVVVDTVEIIKYYVNYRANLDQKHYYKIVFKRIGGGTFGRKTKKERKMCVEIE